jgi:hypothetical protein
MRHIVTYRRTPLNLPDGGKTTDSFHVVDTSTDPPRTVSSHITRNAAVNAAQTLNAP